MGPSDELSFNPTTTTPYQHPLNPKANQKQNQNPLKPSFSTKVHVCSKENENELKVRKKRKLSHLKPSNNHYREEKGAFFLHNTKVQGSLMVVLEEERSMLREREREFEHKRGFMILVISHFSHINFTIHTHPSNHNLKFILLKPKTLKLTTTHIQSNHQIN